jgi:ribosomal protein S18 acetylase RimI-like enzyme
MISEGLGSQEGFGGALEIEGPRLRADQATSADIDQIQACLESAPDYFTRAEGEPPHPGTARLMIADAEADDRRQIFVLAPRAGGPAVGVLDLHLHYPEPGTAQIGLLLFREACQGLGYGKETTAAVEAALTRAGYRALRISVADENTEGRMFWERLGFGIIGRLDRGVTVYEKILY